MREYNNHITFAKQKGPVMTALFSRFRMGTFVSACAAAFLLLFAVHRRREWEDSVRRTFCRLATIYDLTSPLACMQQGPRPTAQRAAMAELRRAAGRCAAHNEGIAYDCFRKLMDRQRAAHGEREAKATLQLLRTWCVPPDGMLRPPVLA